MIPYQSHAQCSAFQRLLWYIGQLLEKKEGYPYRRIFPFWRSLCTYAGVSFDSVLAFAPLRLAGMGTIDFGCAVHPFSEYRPDTILDLILEDVNRKGVRRLAALFWLTGFPDPLYGGFWRLVTMDVFMIRQMMHPIRSRLSGGSIEEVRVNSTRVGGSLPERFV